MKGWRLFGWVAVHLFVSGIVLGMLFAVIMSLPFAFGATVGEFIFDLVFVALFGAIYGGLLGIIDGVLDAVALIIRAACFSSEPRAGRFYRWSALLVALICTTPITLIVVRDMFHLYGIVTQVTVIATAAAVFFAWRLADANVPKVESHPLANAVLFYVEK